MAFPITLTNAFSAATIASLYLRTRTMAAIISTTSPWGRGKIAARFYWKPECSFCGAGRTLLGDIGRDCRYPYGGRLGSVRGLVQTGRDRAVVRSRLVGAASGSQRPGKSSLMVLVGDCRAGVAGNFAFYFVSIAQGSIAVAVTLMYCAPVFVYLASFVLKLEKPTVLKWIAIAVVMLGIALLTQVYDLGASGVTAAGAGAGLLAGCPTRYSFSDSSTRPRTAARRRFSQ